MRSRLSILCLLPLLAIGCSTVKVAPASKPAPAGPPVRIDKLSAQEFPPGESDGYRPPARLAVLLPMTGSLAPAAAGVRDGFLAAYYAENRRRPVVKFYNTQGTGSGAQAALAKAVSEGAQMILGPLTRDEVNAVYAQADGSMPLLTLNRGSKQPPARTSSFALLPDDEGTAAANRLADRGLTSVLVFSSRSDNSERAVTAFAETLRKRGGAVIAEIPAAGSMTDLAPQLAALAKGANPPKAVFIALDASPGRTIAAQLKASALAGLPRIATSLILSGANAKADVELDGIEYPEMPWLLDQGGDLPDADALAKTLPSARGPSQRLFAFGADAWKLTAYFQRLYDEPAFSVRGNTGVLRIEIAGPVLRTPSWAVFSGGRGRPARQAAPGTDAKKPAN